MLFAAGLAATHRTLAPIDLVIIGIYFLIVFGIGFYFSRKERTSEDYFLAGRSIGWFAIGTSLFVSNISTEHFIGLAGSGAAVGLAPGHFEWQASLILLLLGWVFVPFYLRSNVFTMPEFLERRFNRNCATYLASISIIAYIFTKISVHLYAGAIIAESVLGWRPMTAAIILVIATGVYTVAGGLAAVIYTDLVQTLILLAGAIVLTVIGLEKVGGFTGLRALLPPAYFHMFKPVTDPNFPWTGIIFGAPLVGIWYWCTDQMIVQRVLSAKDEAHAKAGTILAGFLKVLPVFILVLPGMMAFALFPQMFPVVEGQITNSNSAYPLMIVNLLPVGLVGLMVAALLAALMGAMSSVFNSASTMVTLDFYKKFRPDCNGSATCIFRPDRHCHHGCTWNSVGSLYPIPEQPALALPAERAGLYQSSNCSLLHIWNLVAAVERRGSYYFFVGWVRSWSRPLCGGSPRQNASVSIQSPPLAHRHEFPALRYSHVCRLRFCSRWRFPPLSSSSSQTNCRAHICHCRRQVGDNSSRCSSSNERDLSRTHNESRI